MTTGTHMLDVPDGAISYTRAGAGDHPVVLLHAGYVDSRMWSRDVAHLAKRGLVVAPDARAHGASSNPTTPFRQCDDIAALIRELDSGPAILVGVSMGAGAAIDTALEHPSLVRAAVISGAGTNEPYFTDPIALSLLRRQQEAVAAMDADAWLAATCAWLPGPRRTLDAVDPQVRALVQQMHVDFVRDHVRADLVAPQVVADSWRRLQEVEVPVLGIVGDLDFSDHRTMCERAVSSVRDGRGVVHIPSAAHFPNLDAPADWEAAVDQFLDSLESPR